MRRVERISGILAAAEGIDPIGNAEGDFLALPSERLCRDRCSKLRRLLLGEIAVGLDQQYPQLVAAKTAHHVGIAHVLEKCARDLEKGGIAGGMGVLIVEQLQIVDVEI